MSFWKKNTSNVVSDYYDNFTDSYLETYGYSIQAFRPENTEELHDYLAKSIGFEDGQEILDAGCGVAGPAVAFAKKFKINIEGLTISAKQKKIGDEYILENKLQKQINIKVGDFHQLKKCYEKKFDKIIFLESLGHSYNPGKVIAEAFQLLKKGGSIYIKDFFPFEIKDKILRAQHEKIIKRINIEYQYNVLNLNDITKSLRSQGLQINYIRKFNFIDDIAARSAFEKENDIMLFKKDETEFRVAEWLEMKFDNPIHNLF